MNERILEIAKQAGLKVDADGEIGPAFYGNVDAGYKKFAELIVKECIDVLEFPSAMKFDNVEFGRMSEYNQGWVNGRKLGIHNLKEHFGINRE